MSFVAGEDARSVRAACGNKGVADRDILCAAAFEFVSAAADTRAVALADCRNFRVFDQNVAALTVVFAKAAADAGAVSGFGPYVTACDIDGSVRVVLAAADGGAPLACRLYRSAGRVVSAVSVYMTAVDGYGSAAAFVAAADTRRVVSSSCGNRAAVDIDGAALRLVTAADARAVSASGGFNRAAVDVDGTGIILVAVILVVTAIAAS